MSNDRKRTRAAGRRRRTPSRRPRTPAERFARALARVDNPATIEKAIELLAAIEERRLAALPEGQEKSTSPAFRPTKAMQVYLLKKRELSDARGYVPQKTVALAAGIDESVVSRWHRVPGFDGWLSTELHTETRRLWPDVLYSCALRARRTGDPREAEPLGRMIGELATGPTFQVDSLGDRGQGVGVTSNYSIVMLIPRPEVPAPKVEA